MRCFAKAPSRSAQPRRGSSFAACCATVAWELAKGTWGKWTKGNKQAPRRGAGGNQGCTLNAAAKPDGAKGALCTGAIHVGRLARRQKRLAVTRASQCFP